MSRNPSLATALVVLGIALLVAPVLFPIQPVEFHDTRRGTTQDRAELEAEGYEVIAYENLSDRGQQLYVRTLRNGGEYHVPAGTGAPEFAYPTRSELMGISDHRARDSRQSVVIERPTDTDLPPPDEPVQYADERHDRRRGTAEDDEPATPTPSVEERRQLVARYDMMYTRTGRPPLTATDSLLRLLSVVGGVLALGLGGYRRSRP